MIKSNHKIILILGISIALFFSFWKINEFPQDVNAEVIIYPNSLRCLQRAHTEQRAPQACFQQLYNRWETKGMATSKAYEVNALVQKIWLFVLSIIFNIFGYSVFSITLASTLISLIVIFLTYRLGRLLYSEEVGLLAAVFLSTAIVYNIMVRSGYDFNIVAATSLAVFYFLYRYLESKKCAYLIITGVLLGLGSLDAAPQFFFTPASIIPILLFDFSGQEKNKMKNLVFNLKNIAIVFLWALIISLVFTALYAWYYKTSIFSIYEAIYTWINLRFHGAQYTHQYVSMGIIESLKYAIAFIKNTFIGMSAFTLDDYALLLEGVPMITPLISVFFIIGLFFLRLKSKADRLLLVWLGINFIVYMFFIKVQTRYVVAFLPAVCIVSAYAIVKVINKINFNKYSHIVRQTIYILIILAITYAGYKNFFVSYKNNDANLRRFYNNSQIAAFVMKNSKAQDCLVVLGENFFSCRDAVIFNLQYKPYKVLYLEEILYNKAQGLDKKQITLEEAKGVIKEWESGALKNDKIIYYIFSEHSIGYYLPAMVPQEIYSYVGIFKNIFLSLHPSSKPTEILRYSNGDPTHSIFVVRK